MRYGHWYYCATCLGRRHTKEDETSNRAGALGFRMVMIRSDTPAVPTRTISHYEYDPVGRSKGCQRKMTYFCLDVQEGSTSGASGSSSESTAHPFGDFREKACQARTRVERMAKSVGEDGQALRTNEGMACVIYDPLTQEYFEGFSGKSKFRRYIPKTIVIPSGNREHQKYDACAEVDAVGKMFAARKRKNISDASLWNCVGVARERTSMRLRRMCVNCKYWLVTVGKAIDFVEDPKRADWRSDSEKPHGKT